MTTLIVFLIGVAVGLWLHNVWAQPWEVDGEE